MIQAISDLLTGGALLALTVTMYWLVLPRLDRLERRVSRIFGEDK